MKINQELKAFWQEKEQQLNSRYILSSYAVYYPNFPDLNHRETGVLYLMESGIYFENIARSMSSFAMLIGYKAGNFEKRVLCFLKEKILRLADFKGRAYVHLDQAEKQNLTDQDSWFKKMISRWLIKNTCLAITFLNETDQEVCCYFDCLEDALLFCQKFEQLE